MTAWWRRYGDWALAIVLCALGELQFWLGAPADASLVGLGVPSALLFAPVALGLAWRRRYPALMIGITTACFLAAGLFVQSRVDSGPVAFFVALLAAYYSAAAWGQDRASLVASGAGFLAIVALDTGRGVFDVNGPAQPVAWVGFVIAWLVGREIGRRRGDVAVLQARARELERDREEKARAAVEEERGRIARELHDVVAHSVSVMVVQAQAGPRLLSDPDRAGGAFASIERAGREALVELRRMLGILRAGDERPAVDPQPGLRSLDGLVSQVRDAGLRVDCTVDGDERPLPVGVDLSAYRIVQEALTNTLKHSKGRRAGIVLRYGASWLDIEVVDDGRGATASTTDHTGHGLIGMRERVALYGGELITGPGDDGGFVVRARLPLNGTPS
jgi:signal transduction histidine kinase